MNEEKKANDVSNTLDDGEVQKLASKSYVDQYRKAIKDEFVKHVKEDKKKISSFKK